jgi:ATP-dependent DNA helicase RecQ
MLCGSKNKKLQQWKLNRLSTYGLLSALKQTEVVNVMDSLIEAGLLQQKEVDERRPTIHITDAGRRVMLETDPLPDAVRMPFPLAKRLAAATRSIEAQDVQTRSPGSDQADAGGQGEPSPEVADLTERLKRWRRKTSAALGIPVYRVLTNATVQRIAEESPTTTEQLESISGVGPATIEQFGYDIVQLILASSGQADGVSSGQADRESSGQSEGESSGQSEGGPTDGPAEVHESPQQDQPVTQPIDDPGEDPEMTLHSDEPSELPRMNTDQGQSDAYWTWRLFRDGYSAQQIASIRRCEISSLVVDLIAAAAGGHTVDPSWISAPEGAKRIQDAVAGAAVGG